MPETRFIQADEWTPQDQPIQVGELRAIPVLDTNGSPIAYVIINAANPIEQARANARLIAAAPDLRGATKSFMASMSNVEQFVGHNQSYREQVCVPRATRALNKL